jgi:hypothetical protein
MWPGRSWFYARRHCFDILLFLLIYQDLCLAGIWVCHVVVYLFSACARVDCGEVGVCGVVGSLQHVFAGPDGGVNEVGKGVERLCYQCSYCQVLAIWRMYWCLVHLGSRPKIRAVGDYRPGPLVSGDAGLLAGELQPLGNENTLTQRDTLH